MGNEWRGGGQPSGHQVDRWSRRRDSLWMLTAFCGFGLAVWAGFLYVGVRARRRAWQVAAGLYGLGAACLLSLIATTPRLPVEGDGGPTFDQSSWQSQAGSVLLLALWGGGSVHALLANRRWLAWLAEDTSSPGGVPPGARPAASPVPSPVPPVPPVPSVPSVAGLEEPWATFVRSAESLSRRIRAAAGQVAAGPLQEALRDLTDRVDRSVAQTRQLAGHGQVLVTARHGIDVAAVEAGLVAARRALATEPDEPGRQIVEAFEAQRAAAARMDEVIDDVATRLRLIDARLGEALARVVELSVQGHAPLELLPASGTGIDAVVADLEALRQALDEVSTPVGPTLPANG